MNHLKIYKPKRQLSLHRQVVYTCLCLAVYRILSHVPLPFMNRAYMQYLISSNGSLGFLNTFTGGNLSNMSVMALGITPYITVSIVIQLLGVVFPALADMQKEGSTGKQKMERITIGVGAGLALLQSVLMMAGYGRSGLLSVFTWYSVLVPAVIMTLGVLALSLMGYLITERFFGNGISLILLAGILSSYLGDGQTLFEVLTVGGLSAKSVLYVALACVGIVVLFAFTIWLNFCEKRVKVTYSNKVPGAGAYRQQNVIPLKLVAGSVVPIIFASSIITIPALIQSLFDIDAAWLRVFNTSDWFSLSAPWANIGIVIYCLLIIGFSYYYVKLNLNEHEIADNLKRSGGIIAGIRPGRPTEDYLREQTRYLTLLGGVGLCIVALVPNAVSSVIGVSGLSFFGTSVIITVSVIGETVKLYQAGRAHKSYQKRSLFAFGKGGLS